MTNSPLQISCPIDFSLMEYEGTVDRDRMPHDVYRCPACASTFATLSEALMKQLRRQFNDE